MDRGAALTLVVLVVAVGLLVPLFLLEAQSARIPRIGVLSPGSPSNPEIRAFSDGLRRLRYTEGRNFTAEYRWSSGHHSRLPAFAAELVQLNVDVIVTAGTPATQAAMQATTTIPIVMLAVGDAVASGLVRNLRRPGGNVTGSSFFLPELTAKRLALIKEAVPGARRALLLVNPDNAAHAPAFRAMTDAARGLGMEARKADLRKPSDLDGVFRLAADWPADVLVVPEDAMLGSQEQRIVALSARQQLPTIGTRHLTVVGGLLSYSVDRAALFDRAAVLVDKILKGAKPGDLPVEQPTTFELVVNVKTANALRLSLPRTLLMRAGELIE